MRLYVTILTVLGLLCGCASSEFSPRGDVRAPPYSGEVVVLDRMPAVGRYTMLGIVIVRGVTLSSDERMFDLLKERAAAQGADAVVLQAPLRTEDNADGGEKRRLAAHAIRRDLSR
ncbi:MAG: hypothetical protein ACI9DC_000428 [Gammaproteobacteria bacterium]|jgi:hypothetical protein